MINLPLLGYKKNQKDNKIKINVLSDFRGFSHIISDTLDKIMNPEGPA